MLPKTCSRGGFLPLSFNREEAQLVCALKWPGIKCLFISAPALGIATYVGKPREVLWIMSGIEAAAFQSEK